MFGLALPSFYLFIYLFISVHQQAMTEVQAMT